MPKSTKQLIVLLVITLTAALLPILPAPAAAQELRNCGAVKVADALEFIATLQNDDGGFTNGFQPESDLGATADAVIAILSAGADLDAFKKGENTPLDYLAAQVKAGKADTAGKLAKVVLAVRAAGADPMKFADADLLALTRAALPKETGLFSKALALLALANLGGQVPAGLIDEVAAARDAKTNGWAFDSSQTVDTNTTALAIQALAAAGKYRPIGAALDYLQSLQNEDGGWPYQNPSQYGTDSDANSTAIVLQALIAAGENPETWNNPAAFLATFQQADGSFTFQLGQPAPSFLATVAALPVACGISLEAISRNTFVR